MTRQGLSRFRKFPKVLICPKLLLSCCTKVIKRGTHKRLQYANQVRDPVQSPIAYDLFVREFFADGVITEAQKSDLWMCGFVSLSLVSTM